MHIADGVLSMPVLAGGAMLAAAGVAAGLKRMDAGKLPQAGVVSAGFFVVTLVHIPVGPTSVHLLFNGLAGLMLGWGVFPAFLAGLVLDGILLGFGGISVLGVNLFNTAAPAVLAWLLLRGRLGGASPLAASLMGAAAGAGAVALTCLLLGLSLAISGEEFIPAAWTAFVMHLPVMVVEGVATGAAVALVRRVRPDILGALPLFGAPARHA